MKKGITSRNGPIKERQWKSLAGPNYITEMLNKLDDPEQIEVKH